MLLGSKERKDTPKLRKEGRCWPPHMHCHRKIGRNKAWIVRHAPKRLHVPTPTTQTIGTNIEGWLLRLCWMRPKRSEMGHNKERKSRCQPEIFWRTNELLVMIRPYAASLLELQMILWRRINHHPWPPSLVAPSRPQMHSSSAGVF